MFHCWPETRIVSLWSRKDPEVAQNLGVRLGTRGCGSGRVCMSKREVFTLAQLAFLRRRFAEIKTVNPDRLTQFHQMFSGCGNRALRQLAGANIRFLSALAANACVRRGIVETESERAEAGLSREAIEFKRALLALDLRRSDGEPARQREMTSGQTSPLEPGSFVRNLMGEEALSHEADLIVVPGTARRTIAVEDESDPQ